MTNSRSKGSTSKLLAIVVAACAVLGAGGLAEAGRKRVVVLDFEGPKGEKFHADLVRLLKKTHTVVPTEKWNGAAEQLDASAPSDRNLKKVARKLKIDAIVEGKIEKRRDEFIVRLKLHAGRSGEVIGDSIDTKAEGPRLDGRAQRDLKDELIGAIDSVESNHVSGGDDEADDVVPRKGKKAEAEAEDAPPRKGKKAEAEDDEAETRPSRKGKKPEAEDDEADARPARKGFSKHLDDERGTDKVDRKAKLADDEDAVPPRKPGRKAAEDDDKLPPKKSGKKLAADDDRPAKKPEPTAAADDDKLPPKKPARKVAEDDDKLPPKRPAKARSVAAADDEASADEVDSGDRPPVDLANSLSPAERALDAVLGLSFTARRMSFAVSPTLRATPPAYKGTPVAGAVLDATVYPLAIGHTRTDQLKNIGLQLLYDRVIVLNSKDPMTGATYSTNESRFWATAVFRHAFGHSERAPVILGSLGFGRQQFNILGKVDIPDVKYSLIAPGAALRYPITPKLILDVDAKLLLVASAGQISDPNQYGRASVFGFEGSAGADYLITPRIFARAAFRAETIGYSFKGTGFQTTSRDGNPMTQDIKGARDSYFGGMATVGYLY